ncbi:MAG: hypothetical protein K6V97_12680 [Actinomycetia bacterium]|nr:hypothetical protein [Actinomycetes bacterium]
MDRQPETQPNPVDPLYAVSVLPADARPVRPATPDECARLPYVVMTGAALGQLLAQLDQLTRDVQDLHRAILELDVMAADAQGLPDAPSLESALEALVDLASAALARTDPDPKS